MVAAAHALWLCACTADPELAEATHASGAYLQTFARLERWTQRMVSSDVRLQGPAALHEAMFAPYRADPDVLWAEVRTGEGWLLFQNPLDSAKLHYVTVDAPALGRLWVALSDACSTRAARVAAPHGARARADAACVVLARPALDGRQSSLRVAFRRASSDAGR
ncbi:MAG: hypothetical protein ABW321_33770 [Polyangiales bacterium]